MSHKSKTRIEFRVDLSKIAIGSFMTNPVIFWNFDISSPAIGKVLTIAGQIVEVELISDKYLSYDPNKYSLKLTPQTMKGLDGREMLVSFSLSHVAKPATKFSKDADAMLKKHSPTCMIHRNGGPGPQWCCTCQFFKMPNIPFSIGYDPSNGKDKAIVTEIQGNKVTAQIDFSELQNEVMEHWESQGIEFQGRDMVTDDPYPMYETFVKEEYDAILDNPMACLSELGFEKLSDYLAAKRAEEPAPEPKKPSIGFASGRRFPKEEQPIGVEVGYCRISEFSTKFFFQKDGKEVEFYIDRDPKTSMAKVIFNPGVTSAGLKFVCELLRELERAQNVK